MRLDAQRITDHDLLTGVGEADHHNRGISRTILVNSQALSPGAYELRVALGASGFQTFRALLRGVNSVDIQGHDGVWVIAGGSSEDCSGIGIAPYSGGYTTSYAGALSRIFGDSYLSLTGVFGPSIVLRDAYIDGTDAVLEFFNASGVSQNLTVYGTLAVK